MTFQWPFTQQPKGPETPREVLVRRLAEGVPKELACRAAGIEWESIKDDDDVQKALAEGEILLFERARDSGVTGIVRAALRHETKTWIPKVEPIGDGKALEDYLRD